MPLNDTPSLRARFWSKVDKTGDCWLWTASLNTNGYGQLMVSLRPIPASRVSWYLAYGVIPDGMLVCHHCDNRRCVRPEHLFLGTHTDNMVDMAAKGRWRNPRSKLTLDQVREIRVLYAVGGVSQDALAKMFGITQSTISSLLSGETWRHV